MRDCVTVTADSVQSEWSRTHSARNTADTAVASGLAVLAVGRRHHRGAKKQCSIT